MERKYYDLTASQLVLAYSQKFTVHKQVNNVCISILVDQELDFDLLEKAITKAYERNDALRIRMVKRENKTMQYFLDKEEPEIEYLDFTGKSFEEMEKVLYKKASQRISKLNKPLSKVYIMKSYDKKQGIFFKVSHFIMDSWAISMLFKDIFSIYDALKNETDLPKALPSYEELLIEDLKYKNTETYKKDRAFFEELYSGDEPLYSHVNGYEVLEEYRKKNKNPELRYGPTISLKTKANNIMLPVSKEIVDKMEAYCAANRLTMQSLVLLAYRSYFSKVNKNQEDITINTVLARRATLKEKNSGGSRVHFFPFRTIFDENTEVKEACEVINEKQSGIFRHSLLDPIETLQLFKSLFDAPQTAGFATTAVTYQPVKLTLKEDVNIETKWYGNGASSQPLYLTVMDGDGLGGLKFYYEFQSANIKLETIHKLHNFMLEFLEKATSTENITIGELL